MINILLTSFIRTARENVKPLTIKLPVRTEQLSKSFKCKMAAATRTNTSEQYLGFLSTDLARCARSVRTKNPQSDISRYRPN